MLKKYSSSLSWWFVAGVTPLPIPNREVKPCRTDDTLFEGKVSSCQDCELEFSRIQYKKPSKRFIFEMAFCIFEFFDIKVKRSNILSYEYGINDGKQ